MDVLRKQDLRARHRNSCRSESIENAMSDLSPNWGRKAKDRMFGRAIEYVKKRLHLNGGR